MRTLDQLGYLLILISVIYCIYINSSKTNINIYLKGFIIDVKKKEKYFNLQFWIGMINSIFLMCAGVVIIRMHYGSIFAAGVVLIFHLINYLVIIISKKKGYI